MIRQWFRFSLGGLLVFITLAAVWFAMTSNSAKRQKAAVDELTKNEAIVQFESTMEAPQWMRDAVGEDYFRNEKTIDFATNQGRKKGSTERKATNDNLKQLSALQDVETLELGNSDGVTDSGLQHLSSLRKLTTIYLYASGVRGPGLAHITALPKLSAISLNNTQLEDSGLEHLGRMKQLTWLRLDNTNVTDVGISRLVEAGKLESLTLGNTKITDEGLETLQRLEQLKSLNVMGTNVTLAGVERFKKAMPQCSISTTFGLGEAPLDKLLFPAGSEPSASDINAKLKDLGIDGEVETQASMPNGPIVSLRLFGTRLSDDVVLSLTKTMPELKTLNIRRGLVGDELMSGLGELPIEYLSLEGTRITNSGLKHLANLPSLRQLILTETAVTDEGLLHLYHIRSLKNVSLDNCRVTPGGARKLREALRN